MISVVIPAFNEQDAIAATVQAARDTLEAAGLEPFEVVVVDDGSTDATGERAAAAGARVLRHPANAGYGRSLKRGIEAARYDTIAITDADGTYPVDRLPDLHERYQAGFDMVVGLRRGSHYRGSWMKLALRRLLKFLVEYSAGSPVLDVNSGLRVFSRGTVLPYFPHLCDTFSFSTSLTLAYLMNGRFVTYVPIAYAKRIGSSKVRIFKDSLRTIQYIVEAVAYYNPLKFFMLFGMLCLAGAVLAFIGSATLHLLSAFVIGIGLVLVAVFSVLLGMLAVQLKQIMHKGGAG